MTAFAGFRLSAVLSLSFDPWLSLEERSAASQRRTARIIIIRSTPRLLVLVWQDLMREKSSKECDTA